MRQSSLRQLSPLVGNVAHVARDCWFPPRQLSSFAGALSDRLKLFLLLHYHGRLVHVTPPEGTSRDCQAD